MAKAAIGFGIVLIILGIAGYYAAQADHRSLTAFIPSVAGVLLVICGAIGSDPDKRMHAMHGAVLVGLLGFLMAAGRILAKTMKGAPAEGLALFSQAAMAIICLIFVILCIRSFISARRARKAGPTG